ncbi:phosphotransferase [Solwaraspora sp. WMMD792]|uniref:phosphotransferase enzyme family protein n=1 Tax=Solwaraspora sp. WMMD792 TaxID=3016099 RepID=UPI0024165D8B|nr:phosphotransferase [Solwaraspora sp. WMMD792]MDG4771565.1 phosphotransferase [Solwaraspora sp. WMMD792]
MFEVVDGTGTAAQPTGLASFASLRRGDDAPDWVRDGVVAAWGLASDTVVRLIVLSENVTFRVDVAGRPALVVRLARPGYATSTVHLRSELRWIEALRRDVGLSTPTPVPGADGDLLQLVRDEAGGTWSAVAFEFVAGTVLEDRDDIPRWFQEIGAVTAVLHRHARQWTPPAGFGRFTWGLADLVGPTARWGDWRRADLSATQRSVLERAEARACDILADRTGSRDPAESVGLIHADLRPSNAMTHSDAMTNADALTVIDFDDCGYGYYLYDFGAALTFYEHRAEAREMAARWLAGYQEHVPLRTADLDVACALSMLRRLTMLGWATTHREDALPADLWAENQPGTVEVAARYLADPLWLVRP